MPVDAPLSPTELRSNRLWILLLAGFSIALLLGSVVFAVVRMPTMLAGQIREARSVEIAIQKDGTTTRRTVESKDAREMLAGWIEASRFQLSTGGEPSGPSETIVFKVIAPNRTSEVWIWNDEVLKAGFIFRAGEPQKLSKKIEKLK